MAQSAELIAHDRKLIADLEAAEVRYGAYPDGRAAGDVVSLAHLYGYYGIDVDDSAWPHRAWAAIVAGGEVGMWPVEDFGDPHVDEEGAQQRALMHARSALADALKRLASEVVAGAKTRLGDGA
jgi:hypothetical protein